MNSSSGKKRLNSAWKPFSGGQVMTIEALSGLGLLALLMCVALSGYESAIVKVRLSELFFSFTTDRLAIQEQWALTGQGASGTTAAKDAGEAVPTGQKHSGELDYVVTRSDSSLVAKGSVANTPFFLTYTPAVIASGVPGSMMWLCGNRKAPAGWIRLPGTAGTDLPAESNLSVCRDN